MKLIKWLLWGLLLLVVLAVSGVIFLVTTVDPNDLKPQISKQLESATGRKLELGGDLSWQFYPWVGFGASDVRLSNRAGFTPENMLEVDEVDVQIKLIPLLSKQLEIGEILLQAPNVHLALNEQGESNWGDLVGAGGSEVSKPEDAAGALLSGLAIQGVKVSDARVIWDDQSAGQSYEVTEFNFNSGAIEPGMPVDIDLSAWVDGSDLPAAANIALAGSLSVNEALDELGFDDMKASFSMQETEANIGISSLGFSLASGQLSINDLQGEASIDQLAAKLAIDQAGFGLETQAAEIGKLAYSGKYDTYPFEGGLNNVRFDVAGNTLAVAAYSLDSELDTLPVKVSGENLQVDLNKQTLDLPDLKLALAEANIDANATVEQLFGELKASGRLVSNTFNPRVLLVGLGMQELLEGIPEEAVNAVSLNTEFVGGLDAVELKQLNLGLDSSALTGDLSIANFEQPAYRFELGLDKINIDSYLAEEQQAAVEEAGPAAVLVLPFAELKGLDAVGQIIIGELQLQGMLINDLLVKVNAMADRIEVAPLRANMYGGQIDNTLVYDISGSAPGLNTDSELTKLNIGPFLQAMQISDRLEGVGNVSANLNSAGLDLNEAIANLNGKIMLKLNDGAISGVNLQKSLIKAESTIKSLSGTDLGLSSELGDKTEFSEFLTNIDISQGVMTISNIDLRAPALRVGGGGTANLNNEALNLDLEVSIVASFEGQGGASLDHLKGQTIPFKISGTLSEPKAFPDLSKLLKKELKKELEKEISERYLGGEAQEGQSLDDALKRTLDEKLSKELGISEPKVEPEASKSDAQTPAAKEPEQPPKSVEDQLKEQLKGKLMNKLFGG